MNLGGIMWGRGPASGMGTPLGFATIFDLVFSSLTVNGSSGSAIPDNTKVFALFSPIRIMEPGV